MLLLELMVHMAGINGAPEQVQSDPDTLAVWMQELYSRAYALCVAARCGCQRAKYAMPCMGHTPFQPPHLTRNVGYT